LKKWGKKRTDGYRSGYEAKIAAGLSARGVRFEYESWAAQLKKAASRGTRCSDCGSKNTEINAKYTPDFTIPIPGSDMRAVVEAKGRLTAKDRKTILAFSKVALSHGCFYFVLIMRNNTLSKASKTRYSDWCRKNGITYAVSAAGIVPKEWYASVP
jgi:hypothetical protein